MFKFFLLACLLPCAVQAFYSINYAADESHPKIMTQPGFFKDAPTPEHVADIYSRLSGQAPLLWEANENMPAIDIFADTSKKPILLEIRGGRLPESVQSVVKSSAFDGNARGPSLQSVVDVLKAHQIAVDTKLMEGNENLSGELTAWLKTQDRPVVILHHEAPTAAHYIQRNLAQSSVTPLTEFQISQYQICLWTGVAMVLIILSSICCIVRMEVIPDSLLYAKFQSARTQKTD